MTEQNKTDAARNIIVCCDGTGNTFGSNNTNVVLTYLSVVQDAGQIACYDPGVGTFDPNNPLTNETFTGLGKLRHWFHETWGGATEAGTQTNVQEAYRFLMSNYREGDRVFLFGFSRGTHAVRLLVVRI